MCIRVVIVVVVVVVIVVVVGGGGGAYIAQVCVFTMFSGSCSKV